MSITKFAHTFYTQLFTYPAYRQQQTIPAGPQLSLSTRIFSMLFAGYLVFTLVGCSTGTIVTNGTATPGNSVPTPTQGPPPPAKGTVLYQANWSQGLAGWQGSQHWKVVDGQLLYDGNGNSSILPPYTPAPGITQYAVETRIQIKSVLATPANVFGIVAAKTPTAAGYQLSVARLKANPPYVGFCHLTVDAMIHQTFQERDYTPNTSWHVYRIEVQGDHASFLIDGSPCSSDTTTQLNQLSAGPPALASSSVAIAVSSFTITAL